jgi:hypothetical protein
MVKYFSVHLTSENLRNTKKILFYTHIYIYNNLIYISRNILKF